MKPETPLSQAAMARFQHNPEQAVAWLNKALPRDYGDFAPLVIEHLKQQDTLAEQLIRKSAEEAAMMIRTLHRRGTKHCALVGGLSEFVLPWLPNDVADLITAPEGDAMQGALLLAGQTAKKA